jgi:hypothetical protein
MAKISLNAKALRAILRGKQRKNKHPAKRAACEGELPSGGTPLSLL